MNQKNQYIFLDGDEDFFFDGEEQNFDEDYQSFRIVEIVGNKYLKVEDMTAYELLTETEEDKIDRENKENESSLILQQHNKDRENRLRQLEKKYEDERQQRIQRKIDAIKQRKKNKKLRTKLRKVYLKYKKDKSPD